MNDNPLWFLSLILSSLLSFFSMALVVEIILALFRIKQIRIRSLFRHLPMLNLMIDFFFSKISTGNFLNPLSCESCIQKMLLQFFSPELREYLSTHQISLVKYLGAELPSLPLIALVFSFSAFTVYVLLRKIPRICSFIRQLNGVIRRGEVCLRPIENQRLKKELARIQVKVLLSEETEIPMAAYLKTILIPKGWAKELPQEEFEAVIAHELEHLRWKDPLFNLFVQFSSLVFWWVPTGWWTKRLTLDQEMACDASVDRYQLDRVALASALLKVASKKNKTEMQMAALCGFSQKGCSPLQRLKMILDPAALPKKSLLWPAIVGTGAGALITLSCMM